MSNWVVTNGIKNLLRQINEWAPDRAHGSDGTIGDLAHQSGRSGHNPDDTPGSLPEWDGDPDNIPEVRALDVTEQLNNGATMAQLVAHIVGLKPWTLRYVIHDRTIWEASNGWRGRPYDGPDPHTGHAHFSGAYSQAADNDTSYNYHLEDVDMPSVDEIISGLYNDLNRNPDPKDPNHQSGLNKLFRQIAREETVAGLWADLNRNPGTADPDGQSGLNKLFRQFVREEVATQLAPVLQDLQSLMAPTKPTA